MSSKHNYKKLSSKASVQVICVTYNQKEYIKDALDSFLMQKTNFKFEVLVGDDCSTDGTSEIVAQYAKKYPNIIKHIKRNKNIGSLANFMDLCETVTAKYVAFCDGDDYWTDEHKLQKQYDYMEKNEDVNICAHRNIIKADENWSLYNYYKNIIPPFTQPTKIAINKKIDISGLVFEWPHTSSLFIRWQKIDFPEWTKKGMIGDITVIFLQLGIKKIYILPDMMSVYRRGTGIVNNTISIEDHFLKTRPDYFRIYVGTIEYFQEHFKNFDTKCFENRLWIEVINYVDAIIKTASWDKLTELKINYPTVYEMAKSLLSEYKNRLLQLNVLGKKQADLLRNRKALESLKSYFSKDIYSDTIKDNQSWDIVINYVDNIISEGDWNKLYALQKECPNNYLKSKSLLMEYQYRLLQLSVLGKQHADLLRKKSTLKLLKPYLYVVYFFKTNSRKIRDIIKKIVPFSSYWIFSLVPKKKKLWVFSGFKQKVYMDNTKYLFEYVTKNHPEVDAVWLTHSKSIYNDLKSQNLKVVKINKLSGIWTMARAYIAISDHFKMSDYNNKYGYNANTKFINLWHGIGIKCMIPEGDVLPNTAEPGVRLSSDILIQKDDSLKQKILKLVKYPFKAPFRELFEKYDGIVCPCEHFINIFANPLKIPSKAHILAGYPRNALIYKNMHYVPQTYNILYAPTYRWKQADEEKMVLLLIENIPNLNSLLTKINACFTIRLHPHTWRNYSEKILTAIANYKNIMISQEKDIYKDLYKYSMMISDYSSIISDFLIMDKPVIYFPFDYSNFVVNDCTFTPSYEASCAGPIVYNWKTLITAIEENFKKPDLYSVKRQQMREVFFPRKYNSENDAELIVTRIKEL